MTGIGIIRTTVVLLLALIASCSSAGVRLAGKEARAAGRLVIHETPAASKAITRLAPEVGTLTRGALGETFQLGPVPSSAPEDLWRSVASPSVRPSVAGQLTKTEQRTQVLLDEILRANSRGDRAARDLLLQRYNAQVDNAALRRPSKVVVGQSGVDRAGHPDTPAQWHQAGVAAAEAQRALEGRLRSAEESLRRIGRADMIDPVRRRLTGEVERYARRSVRHADRVEQNARKKWSRFLDEWCVEDPGVFRALEDALRHRELGQGTRRSTRARRAANVARNETASFASRVRDLAQRRGRQTTCLDIPVTGALSAVPLAGAMGRMFADDGGSLWADDDAPPPPNARPSATAANTPPNARPSINTDWVARYIADILSKSSTRTPRPLSAGTVASTAVVAAVPPTVPTASPPHRIGGVDLWPMTSLGARSFGSVHSALPIGLLTRANEAGALDRVRFSEEMRLRRTQAEADGVASRIGDALTDPINLVFRPSGFTEIAGIALVAATDTPNPKTTGQKALRTLGWILMLAPIAWTLLRRL